MNTQLIINNTRWIRCWRHTASAHQMVNCRASLARHIQQFIIILNMRAGIAFIIKIGRQRFGIHQTAAKLDPRKKHTPVFFMVEIIWLDQRLGKRITAFCPNIAKAFGALLPSRKGKSRFIIKPCLQTFFIACRRKADLKIGIANRFIRMPETIDQGWPQFEDRPPPKKIFGNFANQLWPAGKLVNRFDILGTCRQPCAIMITQIFTNASQFMLYPNTKIMQQFGGANSR